MAIVQISRITHRKGLQENLPQLAGAELGWSIDERRLFIGNGTLEEGAPVIGNTEILTEFSDILAFQTNYTYKGQAAGYTVQTGVTPGTPITQSLQSWLDQFATVKDFGATGDGVTDDTAAINRALYQLYCREVNPQIRRGLFFPAGVYRVTETILIPPYAYLYGEGTDSSIIRLEDGSAVDYVAQTCDSQAQTGVNIGNGGAITPTQVTIANMAFETMDNNADVFLVEDATDFIFTNVSFIGPRTTANLTTDSNPITGVAFASTVSLVTTNIVFDECLFSGLTYGIATNVNSRAVTVSSSKFDTLYQGVLLNGTNPNSLAYSGPSGYKFVQNIFDNIYAEGISFLNVNLNATGYNIFYDVGNHFGGITNPYTACLNFDNNNNVSIGDMYQRPDDYSDGEVLGSKWPRVNLNNTTSIATTNGSEIRMGNYVRKSGLIATLINNEASPITAFTVTDTAFSINYKITRDVTMRTGVITVANVNGTGSLTWTDDYVENASTGIVLSLTQSSGVVSIKYTSTNTGVDAELTYSVTSLSLT